MITGQEVQTTTIIPTSCATCLARQGLPAGEGSHGICETHAAEFVQDWEEKRGPIVAARLWNELQGVSNIDTQAAERRKRSLRQ